MRLSVNQNNGNTYMAKKYQKMEFFLKIFDQKSKEVPSFHPESKEVPSFH